MLRDGRLDQAQTLLDLRELRQVLQLDDNDHHAVVNLLGKTRLECQINDLRQELANASLHDFLQRHGLPVLEDSRLSQRQRDDLERLRLASGLSQPDWALVVERFGPKGEVERQRLLPRRAAWLEDARLLAWLDAQVAQDSLLRPLRRVLAMRVDDLRRQLAPRMAAAGLAPLPLVVEPTGDLPRRLQDPRPGLPSSPFLLSQLRGEPVHQPVVLEAFTACPLFADLFPASLLWLAEQGRLMSFAAGDRVLEKGAASDHLALVLAGDVRVQIGNGELVALGKRQALGEIGVLTHQPPTTSVDAGVEGCRFFCYLRTLSKICSDTPPPSAVHCWPNRRSAWRSPRRSTP